MSAVIFQVPIAELRNLLWFLFEARWVKSETDEGGCSRVGGGGPLHPDLHLTATADLSPTLNRAS